MTGRRDCSGGVQQDGVAVRAHFAAQDLFLIALAFFLRRPAAQVSRRAASYAQLERVDRPRADLTVLHLADEVGPGRGQLVDAPGAVHDEGTRSTQPAEHLRDHRRQLGGVDADDLRAGCGGIRERPEHVEHRPHAELTAHRSGVAEAGMVGGREDEAEAELVDRPGDAVRLSSRSKPSASSTSAEPEADETARLPCFATPAPAAAATSAAAVEMLSVRAPSPPVPAVSTRSARAGVRV